METYDLILSFCFIFAHGLAFLGTKYLLTTLPEKEEEEEEKDYVLTPAISGNFIIKCPIKYFYTQQEKCKKKKIPLNFLEFSQDMLS